MVKTYRNGFVLGLALCCSTVFVLPEVEGGPLTRWRQRRSTGNNTHNVTESAPPAPANMMTVPQNPCPPGQVCPAPSTTTGIPTPILQPQVVGPGGHPIIQQQIPITRQVVPGYRRVVEETPRNTDARVDRLISALEQRLGIKPQAAVTGSTHNLFNKLPKVRIELQTQEGDVTDEVEIDLKMYILEKLIE